MSQPYQYTHLPTMDSSLNSYLHPIGNSEFSQHSRAENPPLTLPSVHNPTPSVPYAFQEYNYTPFDPRPGFTSTVTHGESGEAPTRNNTNHPQSTVSYAYIPVDPSFSRVLPLPTRDTVIQRTDVPEIIPPPNAAQGSSRKSRLRQPPESTWGQMKPIIMGLYIEQNLPLPEVIKEMAEKHNFLAS